MLQIEANYATDNEKPRIVSNNAGLFFTVRFRQKSPKTPL